VARFVSLLVGLAVVVLIAYWVVNTVGGMQAANPEGSSQAKAVIDKAHEDARRIEQEAERRMHETERKTQER
jgi:hypothetical protein